MEFSGLLCSQKCHLTYWGVNNMTVILKQKTVSYILLNGDLPSVDSSFNTIWSWEFIWQYVNIGSGNGWVPSCNNPFPEPTAMLPVDITRLQWVHLIFCTHIFFAIHCGIVCHFLYDLLCCFYMFWWHVCLTITMMSHEPWPWHLKSSITQHFV